jgi:hypothetical protein
VSLTKVERMIESVNVRKSIEVLIHIVVCYRNLFDVLAAHGRLGQAEKVIDGFLQLMGAHRGEVEVIVTSAAVSLLVLLILLSHSYLFLHLPLPSQTAPRQVYHFAPRSRHQGITICQQGKECQDNSKGQPIDSRWSRRRLWRPISRFER